MITDKVSKDIALLCLYHEIGPTEKELSWFYENKIEDMVLNEIMSTEESSEFIRGIMDCQAPNVIDFLVDILSKLEDGDYESRYAITICNYIICEIDYYCSVGFPPDFPKDSFN